MHEAIFAKDCKKKGGRRAFWHIIVPIFERILKFSKKKFGESVKWDYLCGRYLDKHKNNANENTEDNMDGSRYHCF